MGRGIQTPLQLFGHPFQIGLSVSLDQITLHVIDYLNYSTPHQNLVVIAVIELQPCNLHYGQLHLPLTSIILSSSSQLSHLRHLNHLIFAISIISSSSSQPLYLRHLNYLFIRSPTFKSRSKLANMADDVNSDWWGYSIKSLIEENGPEER